jgi:hypothetical protein
MTEPTPDLEGTMASTIARRIAKGERFQEQRREVFRRAYGPGPEDD